MGQETEWTNRKILREFFWEILESINSFSSETLPYFREDALHGSDEELKKRIINLQKGTLWRVLTLIDGTTGPSEWPGVTLVNRETREELSTNFGSAYSRVEGEFLDYLDGSVEVDSSDEPDT